MIKRGEVYLMNFGKQYNSEFGKVRPALIIQNNIANRALEKVYFKGVTVIPMTTQLTIAPDIRVRIEARDNLDKTSDICINELCTLDITRIDLTQKLTQLSHEEMTLIEQKLCRHLGVLN